MNRLKKRLVLIAGGAGFLGSHLCEFMLKKDFKVICLDNLLTGNYNNISHLHRHSDFEFIEADIADFYKIRTLTKLAPNIIFNLASPASPKDYYTYPIETLKAGSQGTLNLLEIARTNNAIFVLASTSEVYGDPLVNPQPESYWGNVNPIGPRSVYDEAKRFAEALTMSYHRIYTVPVRIARIFNTYGPRMKFDDGRVIPSLIYQALTHQPLTIFGTGRQTRSFCYVSDLIIGLYRLLRCSDPNPFNLGNPHEVTILQLAHSIKKLTHSDSPYKFLPASADDPKRRNPDITRAVKLIGWTPKVKLEKGLLLTIKWFKRNLHIR
ncbi:MAG: UDP-glucuronic acid decarboxylase family protein [candidate division WOR-3 bacterium]